jgi:hypothetical protein
VSIVTAPPTARETQVMIAPEQLAPELDVVGGRVFAVILLTLPP